MNHVASPQTPPPSSPAPRRRARHPVRRIATYTLVSSLGLVMLGLAAITAALGTQSGSRWVLNKVAGAVTGPQRTLTFDSTDGTLLSGMTLSGLRYQEGDNSVDVGSLELVWHPSALLRRAVDVDRLHVSDLSVVWHTATVDSDDKPDEPFADPLAGLLPLPVDINIDSVMLRNASIDIDGNLQQLTSLQLSASLQQHKLSLRDVTLDSDLMALQAQLAVTLAAPYPLTSDLQWQWLQSLPSNLTTPAQSNSQAHAEGTLHLAGDLNNLLVSHQLRTPLLMNSDGNVVLDLFAQDSGRSQVFSVIHQVPAQTIALATPQPELGLQIDSAELSTSGWIDALHITGLASVRLLQEAATALPPINLNWNTVVSTQGVELQQLGASTPSGNFSSSGSVRWADGLALNIDYSLREDNARQYQSLLPAGIDPGTIRSSGSVAWQTEGDSSSGNIAIDSLQGELNNYPISAGGSISFGNGEYRLDGINLRSASNVLRLSGHWAQDVDLSWELQAPDLQTLSSLLAGTITANGSIGGTPEQLRLNLMAEGESLSWNDIQVGHLGLQGDYVDGQNTLQLMVSDITLAAQSISSLQFDLSGQPGDHRGALSLNSDVAIARLGFNGAFTSDPSPQWNGNLSSGELRSELGSWRLREPAAIMASAEALSVAAHCWREQAASLCLDANWSANQLDANARLRDLPLAMLNTPSAAQQAAEFPPALIPRLPSGTTVDGSLTADVRVSGDTGAPAGLALRFSVDAESGSITITPPDAAQEQGDDAEDRTDSIQRFIWPVARLSGSLEEGSWQASGDFTLQPDIGSAGVNSQGNAHARLALSNSGVLDGTVDIAFDDLSWLRALAPQIDELEGSLQGQLRVAGSLDAPVPSGNLKLQAPTLSVAALGMQLTDIDLTLLSADGNNASITGMISSGEGNLRIDSELQDLMSDSRRLSLSLNGENFELLNLPELHLVISPQLQVNGSMSGIDASGTLLLPMVDAQPVALPESAVDVSRDTVLVEQSSEPSVHNAAQGDRGILDEIPITAQVRVVLGDEVHFKGFGLTTRLTGDLDITQRATGAPLAYGELAVQEGSFSTYGRTLEIDHGKLLFFGTIDNPALDIRAVRETDDFRVGVQMNGTLRNIRSQLFSTPTLPDGDIISVLVTGRPFAEIGQGSEDSNALIGAITNLGIRQGQSLTNQIRNQLGLDTLTINSDGRTTNSSLTFGKYLTPKLFLRYGLGLFETESTLAVDYTLSERIKLEAQSGSEQSVDLTYTVER